MRRRHLSRGGCAAFLVLFALISVGVLAQAAKGDRTVQTGESRWDRVRLYMIGSAVLLIAETGLITGLLLQRTQRRRAQAELRDSYERIRTLGGRLLRAQETERARLARDLHDDIGQQMALLQFELHTLINSRDEEDALLSGLAEASARATAIARSLHDLSHRLHPVQLRLVGLVPALTALQRELSRTELSIVFSHEGVPASLPPDVMVCLYRVAQEALSNAIRHSRGDRVRVRLRGAHGRLLMCIDDNGGGFDVRTATRGLGLVSMYERAEQIGATLHIHSEPGRGTRLLVQLPWAEAAQAKAV